MHLLYLHQYFCPPGGSGNNRSFELAREWIRAGHRVTLVTSSAYFPKGEILPFQDGVHHFEVEKIEVVVLDVDYSHMMPFRRRVRAFLEFYRKAWKHLRNNPPPDLIYASSTPLTIGELGRKLSHRWKIPFIFETVDVWPDVPVGMGILKNRLLINWLNKKTNRIYQESLGIVALSEGMRKQVLSHGVVGPEKVKTFHNGTHPEQIPFVSRKPKAPVIVLYAGTVGIANDLERLLNAAKWVEENCPQQFEIQILGGGNDRERVEALAKAGKINSVRFLDWVPKEKIPEIFAQADIGVVCFANFAVLEANSANKFYDYLASGLPVVLNYEGWQAKYVREYACGIAVPQGDDIAYGKAIRDLIQSPETRIEMGKAGRRLAEERFNRKVIARELMEWMEALLVEQGRG